MKKIINIHEAKTHLSRLLEQIISGEELIIGKSGKPIAKLIPYTKSQKPRIAGALAGQIIEQKDCWAPDETLLDTADPLLDEGLLAAEEPSAYKAKSQGLSR
ncbi:MAG: type II toxin-antitoxin system Phd/YefM family antitoxin [Chthoniobacterales bacterium]